MEKANNWEEYVMKCPNKCPFGLLSKTYDPFTNAICISCIKCGLKGSYEQFENEAIDSWNSIVDRSLKEKEESKMSEEKVTKQNAEEWEALVQLKQTSKPLIHKRTINTYQKGSMFCIMYVGKNDKMFVAKYPIDDIFRVIEEV